MISIIICSINPDYLDKVTQNIAATIGVPYELLVKDNRQDNLPICQVYNQQAALAKYDLLLFLHEDVVFHSQQWGQDLVKIFKEVPNIGVVGLAGSAYKSAALSGWYTGVKELDAYRVLHNIAGRHVWLQHSPDENKLLHQAVCVDGVFIATTRENWKNIQFNEAELKGFHFYDLDFSIRTHKQNRAVFIWLGVHLEHITQGGDFGTTWVKEAFHFHTYMQTQLPACLNNTKVNDLKIANTWLDYLKTYRITPGLKIKWVRQQKLYLHPALYYNILKFFIYQPFRLSVIHELFKGKQPLSQAQ